MKSKRLLRFYFGADALDGAMQNLILGCALGAGEGIQNTLGCAEKMADIIAAKEELGRLWRYLDGVVAGLDVRTRTALYDYAMARCGVSSLPPDKRREYKRAVVKFTRHARNAARFCEGLRMVDEYYCLIPLSGLDFALAGEH